MPEINGDVTTIPYRAKQVGVAAIRSAQCPWVVAAYVPGS
jgi:hypothetical protein